MSYYFFVKDFEDGRAAEKVVMQYFSEKYTNATIAELPKEEQHRGDFSCQFGIAGTSGSYYFTTEVKFDKMAKKSGNLCFEVTNGRGDLTGIAKTEADNVVYLVPKDDTSVRLFRFDTRMLRKYLYDPINSKKVRQVKGGDKKAFGLMLVSIENVLKDGLASVEEISAELPV